MKTSTFKVDKTKIEEPPFSVEVSITHEWVNVEIVLESNPRSRAYFQIRHEDIKTLSDLLMASYQYLVKK